MAIDFNRSAKMTPYIPTASMGDIVFLLLIFFMVTTVFRQELGLVVELPRAEAAEEVQRERVSNIYIDRTGRISVDDRLVQPRHIADLFSRKLSDNPQMIVSFKTDSYTQYEVVSEVMEALKEANAIRVVFNTDIDASTVPKY
ncbi:MAG: biopolymer transporter ExbD [Candidatus Krumholzibacteria bacterium]|jgi:biopolymer transport protein ExbD|nr:biopolymer transporter ExbD [Candidatus Krumholzibacteria bacterium]